MGARDTHAVLLFIVFLASKKLCSNVLSRYGMRTGQVPGFCNYGWRGFPKVRPGLGFGFGANFFKRRPYVGVLVLRIAFPYALQRLCTTQAPRNLKS